MKEKEKEVITKENIDVITLDNKLQNEEVKKDPIIIHKDFLK